MVFMMSRSLPVLDVALSPHSSSVHSRSYPEMSERRAGRGETS